MKIKKNLPSLFSDPEDHFLSLGDLWDEFASKFPKVDISETAKEVTVTADVPGIKPEDIEIDVNPDNINLRGKTEKEKEEKGRSIYKYERRYGSFNRTFSLPSSVDPEKVSAKMNNGVLTINLQKTKKEKKKIKIEKE